MAANTTCKGHMQTPLTVQVIKRHLAFVQVLHDLQRTDGSNADQLLYLKGRPKVHYPLRLFNANKRFLEVVRLPTELPDAAARHKAQKSWG